MFQRPSLSFLLSALLAAVGVALPTLHAQTVTVYQTNADQSLLLSQQPSVSFSATENGSTEITVTPSVTYQQMDGFGGAMTDSAAYLIYNKLSASQQSALMQWFFSKSNGIGLNFVRSPMGASDFSAQGNFSYDDVASGQTDVNLTNFSIAKDLTYTIPVLKQALAVNANIKVEMLPWSPPAWMKLSGTMDGGNFNDTYYSSLAQYFVKTIQAYQAQGIPVYAIAAQNEPENSNGSYPTESFSAAEETAFIANNLGPALANASLTTKIFGYEHNWNDTTYPQTILGNSVAYPYVAGTSWHCYSGSPSAQSTVQANYPNKGTWFTECSGETNGSFAGDLAWGMENLIIGATRNYAKAVVEWNLALDQNSGPTNGGCTNCRGFVTINDSATPATITYNVENYLYGHAAKFVQPGAYRVESNSAAAGAGGIEDVAFQNPDGSIALIAFNDATTSTTFDVNYAPTNTNFTYTLPAGAVATFTWTPAGAIAAPTNLAVTTPSGTTTQLNLSWTASTTSGVTYTVYRSTTNGFTPGSGNLVTSGLGTTTYNNTGLASGTTYYYVVEAVSSTATSAPSNQASGVTGAVVPSAPTSLTATPANDAQINLSWTAPTTGGTVTYTLYRSTTSGFTPGSGNLIASALGSTTYANTGLTPATTYYYVVQAVNSAGTSPSSNQATGATPAAPAPPTSVKATAASSSQINLSWTASVTSGVTYTVYGSTTSGFTPGSGNQIASGVSGTTYSNTGLTASTAYYYVVEAVNSNGTSAASNQATATTSATAPSAPSALNATVISSTQVNLSWTASPTSGVTYSLYRSTTSGFTPGSGTLVASGLSATTYSNTGLAPLTTYYFVVEAANSAGNSPASNQATAITPSASSGISTSAYYQIVNEASGSCVDDTSGNTANGTVLQQYACAAIGTNVNQEWKFTLIADDYYEVTTYNASTLGWDVVNLGTSPGTNMQLYTYGGGLNQQFEAVLLATGYYEFIDRNSGLCLYVPNSNNNQQLQINTCNGSTSESFKLNNVAAVLPAAPTSLTATASSSSAINLSWTASTTTGVTYNVYGSTTSGFTPGSGNLIAGGLSTTTYSNTGLAASTTYYYVVEAVDSNGSSPASNQASATTAAAGGGSGISTTRYYQIVNQANGLCIDDTSGNTSNGTVLQQYTCYANNTNQQWLFTATSGGYYEITTYNSSTAAWNVVNNGTSPGTGMQLWAYGGGLNEQFEPVLLSSGYYEFIDHNSGLCLNAPNSNNNQQLQINTCNGSTSEAFQLNLQ